MSTPVTDYDLKAVRVILRNNGVDELSQFDLALIDRYFAIYEGNVAKTANAFLRALKGSPNG